MSKTEYSHTLEPGGGGGWGGGGVLIWGGMTRFPLYARFNVYHFSWK